MQNLNLLLVIAFQIDTILETMGNSQLEREAKRDYSKVSSLIKSIVNRTNKNLDDETREHFAITADLISRLVNTAVNAANNDNIDKFMKLLGEVENG